MGMLRNINCCRNYAAKLHPSEFPRLAIRQDITGLRDLIGLTKHRSDGSSTRPLAKSLPTRSIAHHLAHVVAPENSLGVEESHTRVHVQSL